MVDRKAHLVDLRASIAAAKALIAANKIRIAETNAHIKTNAGVYQIVDEKTRAETMKALHQGLQDACAAYIESCKAKGLDGVRLRAITFNRMTYALDQLNKFRKANP